MIELPYGGSFEVSDLVDHVRRSGRDFIICGQQKASFDNHTKPKSLDFWLRAYARDKNRKQAENKVTSAIVSTGLFKQTRGLVCPDTGRKCKGLVLCSES